ncbi:MAG TPA: phosphotransferase [Mycobacteriales bacterium]|nr:phosphotransferase [Mycobacteriales bacterium]
MVDGTAELGELGGAIYVHWPDGRAGVVTGSQGTSLEHLRLSTNVLGDLRSRGLPVPRYDHVVALSTGVVALVQERLPGRPMTLRHNRRNMRTLIDANELFANALADHRDVPVPEMNLRESGPVLPCYGWGDEQWHEVLATYNTQSRRLLDQIHAVGDEGPGAMDGDDLLMFDFTGENILCDDSGSVTGIVDWNWGIGRGDRHSTMVGVRVGMAWGTLNPNVGREFYEAMELLDEHLAAVLDPPRFRMYVAHAVLHRVSWGIRHWPADVVGAFMRTGEKLLTRPA